MQIPEKTLITRIGSDLLVVIHFRGVEGAACSAQSTRRAARSSRRRIDDLESEAAEKLRERRLLIGILNGQTFPSPHALPLQQGFLRTAVPEAAIPEGSLPQRSP